jgi:Natural resistance-associated macrophage protein
LRRQLITFLAIVGPGLIVMVGDNDAGGVATYAQAGQNYGYSLLWVLLLLIPVLIVNQEMVVRLGAVTGVGHARLINERFGRFWGWFASGHDDDPGGAHELAHAAARPAQAGAVVDRDQGRRADATRLPGRLGLAADREGRPARPRLTRPRTPVPMTLPGNREHDTGGGGASNERYLS